MRWTIGFFTARHPEIDPQEIGTSYAILAKITLNAPSYAEAVKLAKERVDLEQLRAELTRRWPNAKYVGYTGQHRSKKAGRTWLRSQTTWRIID